VVAVVGALAETLIRAGQACSRRQHSIEQKLPAVLAASPQLTALARHVRAFATMMRGRHGQELETWMTAIDIDNWPQKRSSDLVVYSVQWVRVGVWVGWMR
jgi:hypothetical protein